MSYLSVAGSSSAGLGWYIWTAALLVLGALVAGCQTVPRQQADRTPIDVAAGAQLERTWRLGWGYVPGPGKLAVGPLHTLEEDNTLATFGTGEVIAVVVYLHGCDGLDPRAHEFFWRRLAAHGIAVVMPDSFAREGRTVVCGRQSADVYAARLAELDYARARLSQLPWAAHASFIAYGHSEGAVALSRHTGTGFDFAVITGYGCRRFELTVPTLAILSKHDPALLGRHCRRVPERVLLDGSRHDVLGLGEAQDEFVRFVLQQLVMQ